MSRRYCILKLYVNQKLMAQRKIEVVNIDEQIKKWKTFYALKHHNYQIYMQLPSSFNHK